MIVYTLYTVVFSSMWSIVTSLSCWLFGATLPPSPYRIRVSHSSSQGFSTPHPHYYVFPGARVLIPTIICTLLEDILSRVDHKLHQFLRNEGGRCGQSRRTSKRSGVTPNEPAPLNSSITGYLLDGGVLFSYFQMFWTGVFAFAYSTTVTAASSLLVFVFGLFGNFGYTALDHFRFFLVGSVQIYTTLKAGSFLKSFPLRSDPSLLRFLYLVLKIVYSHSQVLERFDGNGTLDRRYLNGNPERTTTPLEELTSNRHLIISYPSNQGSTVWNATTLSTILFDSIQSTTTISFSLSLLNSASILLPQYFRLNLSSSRRRDAIFKETVPDEPSLPGSPDELGSGRRLPQGGTIPRDSKHPKSPNTNLEEPAPENEEEADTSILPPATLVPVPEGVTRYLSAGSHHNNNDLAEFTEISITPSLSTTPTLFLSSNSDFSDPFTLYSFTSPSPSTPRTPHPPKTLCKKEHTLVNDRSSFFCHSPPPSTDPLASFHSNDEFMKTLKLEGHCPIGQGSFGTVWKATGGEGRGRQYAVKIVKRVRGYDKVLANEIAAMWNVSKSRWAVQLDYWQASEDAVLLAMRYCMGGSLMNLWESLGCRMDSKLAVFYAAELILAIHDLHTRGIMHRDIKLDNIMLDNGHIRIADFGLALSFDHGSVSKAIHPFFCRLVEIGGDAFPPLFAAPHNPHIARGACGTPGYGPPEVWNEEEYSFGVDYFAMGCTLHAMLTGDLPYRWVEKDDDYDLKELRIDPRGFLTEVERDFLTKVLANKPSHRLSVRRMKQHLMFTHIDWNALIQGQVEPPTP